jgi:hypothetical protein
LSWRFVSRLLEQVAAKLCQLAVTVPQTPSRSFRRVFRLLSSAQSAEAIEALLTRAGFTSFRRVPTRLPVMVRIVLARPGMG